MDFDGKIVLITGSSRGIGAAIAKSFAGEGATVVINYIQNADAAADVVAACEEAGGRATSIQADVTSAEQIQSLVDQTLTDFAKIDVVVNNAFKPFTFDPDNRKQFWDLDWNDYQGQLDGALFSTYTMCQTVLPALRKRTQGSIINMASDLVARPTIPYHDYTTAKSALIGFSRNLAMELGPLGIRVNCVAPGLVYPTDASRKTKERLKETIIAQTPMRRIASPEDVTGPVLFLASDWSRFMTGQTLYVDGGLVMK
ncbi:MAG: 3-oxoacyl-ACP reductase [Rhodospirillaceae bacterium]|nr:3-oxoacyl-ACP reductase [Rhodospirillaceae bacterium]|tara:strand:+ start:111102 stop:111869 length:768 start_codon:yes stop_codon:yes gene_type:complete